MGGGPLNYALLNNDQIQATMTDLESKTYASMMKPASTTNDGWSTVQQTSLSKSTMNTAAETISTLTNHPAIDLNYDSIYLNKKVPETEIASKLNFSTRRSAAVIQSLLHDADLQKVREVNKIKADKEKDVKLKSES